MKKYFIPLVFLTMLFSNSASASFPDINDSYHLKAVNWLQDNGVVQGYGDGTFKPAKNVSRVEFLKMIYETLGDFKQVEVELPFKDVTDGEWYVKYVKKAYAEGVINGYPDGTFKPDNDINVVEASKIVANAFFNVDTLYNDGKNYLQCAETDMSYFKNEWYGKYLIVLDARCLMPIDAFAEAAFIPSKMMERGGMAVMLYMAKASKDNGNKKYDDKIEPEPLKNVNKITKIDNPYVEILAETKATSYSVMTDVIVDLDDHDVSDDEINAVIDNASNLMVNKTGVPLELRKIKRVHYSTMFKKDGNSSHWPILQEIYQDETPPNYFVLLFKDDISTTYGGYASNVNIPNSCNEFKSETEPSTFVFGAVIDWDHMYSRCGYDDSNPPKHISDVAINGECRNQAGMQCVFSNDFNYYKCKDEMDSPSLYSSSKYVFNAAGIVHELLHNVGSDGNYDHFGTPKCNEYMGDKQYDDGSLSGAQSYAVICPAVFDVFKKSYVGCTP